ncbi:hypothetical protein [Haloarchaeobius sp. DFWS5]|uniref:hypothetical protein n=1 Tax=Haloarchaeobius sp. DFWS5 TaxID=3446114 RepID=UPI003EB702B9
MSNPSPSSSGRGLVLVGTVLAAFGTYGPWVRTNPTLSPDRPVVAIGLFKQFAGFTPLDWVVVATALVAAVAVGRNWRPTRRWTASTVAGVVTVAWTLTYTTTGSGYVVLAPYTGTFVLTPQWYVAFLGGLLLLGNGLGRLIHARVGSNDTHATATEAVSRR